MKPKYFYKLHNPGSSHAHVRQLFLHSWRLAHMGTAKSCFARWGQSYTPDACPLGHKASAV
eukprot:12422402-Karenia_brevis.AAC.1